MSTESSSTTSTGASNSHAGIAGVIGAVVTVVLYWINLALVGQPVIDPSGASITVIISGFLAAYLAATYAGR